MIKQNRPHDCLPVAFQIVTGIDPFPYMRESDLWHIQDIQSVAYKHGLAIVVYERWPKIYKDCALIPCEEFEPILIQVMLRYDGIIIIPGHALAKIGPQVFDPATGLQRSGWPSTEMYLAVIKIESE